MASHIDPTFDTMYGGEHATTDMVPWDIGGPQPVVQQLVAYGGVRGRVLDAGTGPGYHAIHCASHGYPVVGVDASAAAIDRAEHNAERAGVRVDFQVADATTLTGFDDCFDTVIDCAFYHVLADDEDAQARYAHTLHRVTRPGARLFMFELGRHPVNGVHLDGLSADTLERVLATARWRIDHLSTSTYLSIFSPQTIAFLAQVESGRGIAPVMKSLVEQLETTGAARNKQLVHLPVWALAATRLN
jgi:SAM-dependent methyltransferase